MPSGYSKREEHARLLLLLNKFHEICMQNEIKYSLFAGSLLGAVREKGFIPWDDDVDICMTRAEYEKLNKFLYKIDCGKGFSFLNHIDAQIPKFYMKEEGFPTVWLDIFIFDDITESKLFQKIKKAGTAFLTGFTKNSAEWKMTDAKQTYAKWMYKAMYLDYLLGKLFPRKWKMRIRNWFRKGCFRGSGKFIYSSNDQYKGMILVYPASMMSEYQIVPFESADLMIMSDYHRYLNTFYGSDYMIPQKWGAGQFASHDMTRIMLEAQGD